jgi:hypothetical protein
MKDRPPFSLREHESLFALINRTYVHSMFDQLDDEPPARIYAQTIIRWFAGNLSKEQTAKYISSCNIFFQLPVRSPWLLDPSVLAQVDVLGNLLANEFGWFENKEGQQTLHKTWDKVANRAHELLEFIGKYPDILEGQSRINMALFHLIENEFSMESDAATLCEKRRLSGWLRSFAQPRSLTG